MRIIIDRDAVCAGDDMNHHREEFVVPDDITIAGLFEFLEFKYIPVIAGNNVVWTHYHPSLINLKKTTNSIYTITAILIDIESTLFRCIKFSYNLF